jgi:pimeloyl-ACP methyl ester carboxylesterase
MAASSKLPQAPDIPALSFSETGSGPPLLLIHGLMATGAMFEPVLARLSSRHRVILPDLRGCGRSRSLPPPYSTAHLADDLSHLLDHLGIRSVAVLGYSQGGAVAQQFVLDHPERCDRLVLACTYAFNMATVREKLEGHLVPILLAIFGMRRFVRLVLAQGLKRVPPARAASVAEMIASQDKRVTIEAWRAAMAFDSRSRLREIRCPTLIVAGSADQAVPMHHARMLQQGIAGSSLAVIEGGDHALMWACPEKLLEIVEPFLDPDAEFRPRL